MEFVGTETQQKALFSAYYAFKAEKLVVVADTTNSFYNSKYVTLPDLLEIGRPALHKHGLAVLEEISSDKIELVLFYVGKDVSPKESVGGYVRLVYRITERLIDAALPIEQVALATNKDGAPKTITNPAHNVQGYVSYMRRQAHMALLGIYPEKDDDANSLSRQVNRQQPPRIQRPPAQPAAAAQQPGLPNAQPDSDVPF